MRTMDEVTRSVCRLCGSDTGCHVNIFDVPDGPHGCMTKIESVVPDIVILRYDSLPKSICHICLSKVRDFYDFRVRCRETQIKLKEKYQPWPSSALEVTKNEEPDMNVPSPTVVFLGGPLAYPFSVKEVEVLTLSDDEEVNTNGGPSQSKSQIGENLPIDTSRSQLNSVSVIGQNLAVKKPPMNHPHPAEDIPMQRNEESSTPRMELNVSAALHQPLQNIKSVMKDSNQSVSSISPKPGCSVSNNTARATGPNFSVIGNKTTSKPKDPAKVFKPKPKPKCKQKKTDSMAPLNSSDFSCIQLSAEKVIYTCNACNKIFINEMSLRVHSCADVNVPDKIEATRGLSSGKIYDDSNSSSSSIEFLD